MIRGLGTRTGQRACPVPERSEWYGIVVQGRKVGCSDARNVGRYAMNPSVNEWFMVRI